MPFQLTLLEREKISQMYFAKALKREERMAPATNGTSHE